MNLGDVRNLLAYNRWANERMFTCLEKVSDEQFRAQRKSSFPSLRESVFHILGAEWLWLKRWSGNSPRANVANPKVSAEVWDGLQPRDKPTFAELATVAGLRNFSTAIERERERFVAQLTDERLHAPLSFHDMSGTPFSEPLVELVQHLVNHGSYHRGQVTTLLREAGAETVSLDMLYFFREQRAAAAR